MSGVTVAGKKQKMGPGRIILAIVLNAILITQLSHQ